MIPTPYRDPLLIKTAVSVLLGTSGIAAGWWLLHQVRVAKERIGKGREV